MEDIAFTNHLSAFKTDQISSFENLFVGQRCDKDIEEVTRAIEEGRPILGFCEGGKRSFSTIFLPFHANRMHPFNFRELMRRHRFPQEFIEFCELAGTIESKTDTYATYEQEPTDKEKKTLLPLLRRFLNILPSSEQFHSWFGGIA
jgi:hypothetical protein